jgi:hypothetical protein
MLHSLVKFGLDAETVYRWIEALKNNSCPKVEKFGPLGLVDIQGCLKVLSLAISSFWETRDQEELIGCRTYR